MFVSLRISVKKNTLIFRINYFYSQDVQTKTKNTFLIQVKKINI